jgi:hypothetical protein
MDQEPQAAAVDQPPVPPVAPVERPIHPAPKPGQKAVRRVKTTGKTLAHKKAAPKKAAPKDTATKRGGGGGLKRTPLRRKTSLRARSRVRR